MLRAHGIRIGELIGQTSLELWVKDMVTGLLLLDNIPGFHGKGRILQWMWGVFCIMYMNSFIMPSSELIETYPCSISQSVQLRVKNFRVFLD